MQLVEECWGEGVGGGVGEGHSVKYIAIIIKNLTHENKSKGNKIKPLTNKQKGHHTIPCQLAEVTQ